MKTKGKELTPIDESQSRQLRVLGDRLTSILRIILNEEPCRGKPLRDLARTLDLDFSTCQRIARAAACPDPLRAITELPGTLALSAFLDAVGKWETRATDRRQATRTLAEYTEAVRTLGGSHAKLKRRLRMSGLVEDRASRLEQSAGMPDSGFGDQETRRQIFELATRLLRARLRGFISINAFGPATSDDTSPPVRCELGTITASLGYTGGAGAHPLIAANFRGISGHPLQTHAQLGRLTAGGGGTLESGTSIIEHLCSTPRPPITSVGRAGRVLHVVDVPMSDRPVPVDIVTATRAQPTASPLTRRPMHETFYVKTRLPNQRVILDVFMHHTLATSAVASSGVLQTDPSLLNLRGTEPANAWEDRLPTAHTLQQLGFGLHAAGSDLWDKHATAAGELFERFAWNPDEFMLLRLDVSYPVWNAFYYVDFDFQSDGAQ